VDLVDVPGIAKMLGGVSRQRVHQLAQRPDFPKPIATLSVGKIWNRTDIERWIAASGRNAPDEI
jgi:predicted DNA-binding transcriptional regulator AlpA